MDSEHPACQDSSIATSAALSSKPRLLVFIVAYNAEGTISAVLSRIPASLIADYAVEVLVMRAPDLTKASLTQKVEAVVTVSKQPAHMTELRLGACAG